MFGMGLVGGEGLGCFGHGDRFPDLVMFHELRDVLVLAVRGGGLDGAVADKHGVVGDY